MHTILIFNSFFYFRIEISLPDEQQEESRQVAIESQSTVVTAGSSNQQQTPPDIAKKSTSRKSLTCIGPINSPGKVNYPINLTLCF